LHAVDAIDFEALVLETIAEGSNHDQPPNSEDIASAFKLADVDDEGVVDEIEFVHIFELIEAGGVHGLSGGRLNIKAKKKRREFLKQIAAKREAAHNSVPPANAGAAEAVENEDFDEEETEVETVESTRKKMKMDAVAVQKHTREVADLTQKRMAAAFAADIAKLKAAHAVALAAERDKAHALREHLHEVILALAEAREALKAQKAAAEAEAEAVATAQARKDAAALAKVQEERRIKDAAAAEVRANLRKRAEAITAAAGGPKNRPVLRARPVRGSDGGEGFFGAVIGSERTRPLRPGPRGGSLERQRSASISPARASSREDARSSSQPRASPSPSSFWDRQSAQSLDAKPRRNERSDGVDERRLALMEQKRLWEKRNNNGTHYTTAPDSSSDRLAAPLPSARRNARTKKPLPPMEPHYTPPSWADSDWGNKKHNVLPSP